jgi:hypothetical protein
MNRRYLSQPHSHVISTFISDTTIDMPSEPRSLWEQLDSEVEPWRRGRMALVVIGASYLLMQGLGVYETVSVENLEAVMGFAVFCAVFWLLFYLIWIGVNWIRWLAGAWLGLSGFSFLIWALRDGDLLLAAAGTINCLIATYFCISPSVYFFAKRQRENRSWLHSGMVVAVFVLLSFTFFIGSVALFAYRARAEAGAIEFAQEASIHIYGDQDRDWMFANLAPLDRASNTPKSLNAFFDQNVGRLGPVLQISTPAARSVRLVYHFPTYLGFRVQLAADGKSGYGPVRIHFWIADYGNGWQIDRTWWERTYTEAPPSYK